MLRDSIFFLQKYDNIHIQFYRLNVALKNIEADDIITHLRIHYYNCGIPIFCGFRRYKLGMNFNIQ